MPKKPVKKIVAKKFGKKPVKKTKAKAAVKPAAVTAPRGPTPAQQAVQVLQAERDALANRVTVLEQWIEQARTSGVVDFTSAEAILHPAQVAEEQGDSNAP